VQIAKPARTREKIEKRKREKFVDDQFRIISLGMFIIIVQNLDSRYSS
jgi:hypothetical protein